MAPVLVRSVSLVLVAAGLLATTACAGVLRAGPLLADGRTADTGTNQLCTPPGLGNGAVVGVHIENVGREPVVITEVSLSGAESMELAEAVLIPIPPPDPRDGSITMPPPNGPADPSVLDGYPAAVGATVQAGEEWSLGVRLRAHDLPATVRSIGVEHEDELNQRFTSYSSTSVTIRNRCF